MSEFERTKLECKRAIALAFVDTYEELGGKDSVSVLSDAIARRLNQRGIAISKPELSEILDSIAKGITVFTAAVNPDRANPDVADLLRYCGDQPGDDWVKRVERLNAIIDGMNGRGRTCECKRAIVGTVVV